MFDEYKVPLKPTIFGLNLAELLKKVFKRPKNTKEMVDIRVNLPRDPAHHPKTALFTLKHKYHRATKVELIEPWEDDHPKPNINFTTLVAMPTTDFCEILEDVEQYADHVFFRCDPENLRIHSPDEEYTVTLPKYELNRLHYRSQNPQTNAQFSTAYLVPYVKALKPLTDTLVLEFDTDNPLRLTAYLDAPNIETALLGTSEFSKLVFYMAPRVEA